MIYPDNFEQKIEFLKIRQLLVDRCLSPLGEEKVGEMCFLTSQEEIESRLAQTEEFVRLREEEDAFPMDGFHDTREELKRIRVVGSWIDQGALFNLCRSLQTLNGIVAFLRRNEENPKYPSLLALASEVTTFPEVTKRIDAILDKFGQVKDNASPRLAEIRGELTSTMNGISRTLNTILRKAQAEGYVDKDVSPSVRDGRLVIPVDPAYKRKVRGIVHDESASGKTVFIEPSEVVEANNRIRELEAEERREIIRVLTDFTAYLRPFLPDLLQSYDFLSTIDFIQAKASLATLIGGIKPLLEDIPLIDWVQATHPLLDLSLKKQGRKIVPLDITLEKPNRILVISGPNAGGKSVCLKTVGLLQYMVQCGLLIPLKENSRVGLFRDIFIDIGDEQSIENDLSTYSSHLLNMKQFERYCNERSLLLIDEFGSGTEPSMGAAIAEALLERFNRKESFGVITTHYQNLKHFANEHEGVVNGAMLYDRHEMRPLFQLAIGNPGSSFAVEIARGIGLPEEVITQASEIVGSDYINMDKYLQDVARDRRYWERKRDEIRRERKRLAEITSKYEADLEEIDRQRKEILAQAKEEAGRLLAESNARIENTIRGIQEAKADKEKTKKLRQSLSTFREEVETTSETKATVKCGKSKREQSPRSPRLRVVAGGTKTTKPPKPNPTLQEGDAVRLKGQTSPGKIMEVDGKKATVAFGMIKTTVPLSQLERVSGRQIKREAKASNVRDLLHERKLNFKPDIDVRGMRGDEALIAVTYFVDDAIQLNIPRIRILHGTGTGALRQIIREYLSGVNGVARFQDEHVQFGGAGITVVELE